MQSYTEIAAGTTLTASRTEVLNNDKTALSCSSGTAYPTTNLQVGMLCLRTDLNKLYELRSVGPDTWICVADLAKNLNTILASTSAGAANVYTASPDPAIESYVANTLYFTVFTSANSSATPTLNFNALGAKTVKRVGGGAVVAGDIAPGMLGILVYDGTDMILLNPAMADKIPTAGGTVNAITATLTPAPLAYTTDGIYMAVMAGANSSTAPTINFNGLGAKAIRKTTSQILSPGDLQGGVVAVFRYDGTRMILMNPAKGVLQGKQSVWIPASAMQPHSTNGAVPSEGVWTSTMYRVLGFDQTTDKFAQFMIAAPKSWDLGAVTAKFYWVGGNTDGLDVVWSIRGKAEGDAEAYGSAFGTAVTVTDNSGDNIRVSAETAAVTLAGAIVAEDLLTFEVSRAASNGADTHAAMAYLIGVKLIMNFNAADDS